MSKENKYTVWNDLVKVQPFNWDLFIVRPSSLAAFGKHMKECGWDKAARKEALSTMKEALDAGGAMFYHGQIMVLPDEWLESHVWHEALHAAIHYWEEAGAQLGLYDNQEVLTYTQGHIVKLVKEKVYTEEVEDAGTESEGRISLGHSGEDLSDQSASRKAGPRRRSKQAWR